MLRRVLFHNYRLLYRLERRLKLALTPGGRLLGAGLVVSGVFGVDVTKSYAFEVFALGLGLLFVAWVGVLLSRPSFTVHRMLPRFATVDQPVRYVALVQNTGQSMRTDIALREQPEIRLPSYAELLSTREPGAGRRNPVDRYLGYPRWSWLVRHREGFRAAESTVAALGPGDAANVELQIVPTRRGPVRLGRLAVLSPEPLGLLRKVRRCGDPASLLVLPRIYPVPSLSLAGGRQHRSRGAADPRSIAGSDEFRSVREYRPGDPLRRIDWRAWARLGQPMVKQFHDERRGGVVVYLDTQGTAHSEQFEAAVSVAASLIEALRACGVVELACPVEASAPRGRGRRGGWQLGRASTRETALALLARLEATTVDPEQQGRALGQLGRPDAVVAVLLGWDRARQDLMGLLDRHTGGRAYPIVVVDEGEAAPARAAADAGGWPAVVRSASIGGDLSDLCERLQRGAGTPRPIAAARPRPEETAAVAGAP